jgi:hypothetical protein
MYIKKYMVDHPFSEQRCTYFTYNLYRMMIGTQGDNTVKKFEVYTLLQEHNNKSKQFLISWNLFWYIRTLSIVIIYLLIMACNWFWVLGKSSRGNWKMRTWLYILWLWYIISLSCTTGFDGRGPDLSYCLNYYII